jgi:uncharacterized damage-inducible protein DinB
MYTTVQGFIEDYRNEAENTLKLLDTLTDESLNQEVAPGYWTLGGLAWHLAAYSGLLQPTGVEFEMPPEHSGAPASASEIANIYRKKTQSLLEAVRTQWTDKKLQENIVVYDYQWTVGLTIHIFLKHEIHHRGQLTILMRQAGLPVTGVYGPSKEEEAGTGNTLV